MNENQFLRALYNTYQLWYELPEGDSKEHDAYSNFEFVNRVIEDRIGVGKAWILAEHAKYLVRFVRWSHLNINDLNWSITRKGYNQ